MPGHARARRVSGRNRAPAKDAARPCEKAPRTLAGSLRAQCENRPVMSESPFDAGAVRALLFDLGGVVIGFDFKRAFRIWADLAGCDPAELERGFCIDEAYERHERGEIDAAGYFGELRRNLGLSLSDEQLIAGWNDIYLGVIAGMPALLFSRRGDTSRCSRSPTRIRRIATLGPSALRTNLPVFRSIFVSSDLGLRKPDPEAFCAVAARTGLKVSELLFFDDTPENVAGARVAGMPAVLVKSTTDVRRALTQLGVEQRAGESRA